MRDARHIALALVFVLMIAAFGFVGGCSWHAANTRQEAEHITVTDTTWFTITETKMVPSPPDTVLKTIIKYVKVPFYICNTDTIVEQVEVPLPFEQHFARLDSVADVWYSGFEAKIDSARVYKYTTTEVVNHYHHIIEANNMVGANAGFMDASLFYMHRFGKLWVGASAGYTYQGQPTARASLGFQF